MRITNHSLGLYCQLEFHPSNSFGHGCNRVVGELYAPSTLDKTQAVSASNTSHNTTINTISKNIFNHHNNSYVLKRIIFGNWSRGLFTVEPNVWNEKEEIIDVSDNVYFFFIKNKLTFLFAIIVQLSNFLTSSIYLFSLLINSRLGNLAKCEKV